MNRNHQVKRPVGIWIRVSTEDQAKGDSPEHHEHRARCYAESKDWEVVEVYHLEGVSGKNVGDHAETKRMLKDIESGHITGLIFSKLARLARSTRQLLDFADVFRDAGADLVSLQESIDTSTPAGRLFYTMIAAMAQWEREEIADRVSASVPIRAKLGKPLGGQAPFGYQWKDKKLIPDPKEAPIRKRVHELFREHRRKKTVAQLLNQAGYRTRNGSRFSDTTVARLLDDPIVKGLRRANYSQKPNGANKGLYKPETDWVYSNVEPIISEELWDECHAIIVGQRKSRKKPSKRAVNLFAGLIYCECGKRMYVPSRTQKYVCSKCRNKIPIDDMEHIFIEQLKGFMLSPKEVESYLQEASVTISERQATLNRLMTQLEQAKQEMDALFKLYHDGQIPTKGFGERYAPIEKRQKELEYQTAEAQAQLDILKVENLCCDHILMEGRDLAERWPKLNRDEKRRIVEDLTEEIIIGKEEEVTINLLYFPSFKDVAKEQRTASGL